jgi:hypothetical protein
MPLNLGPLELQADYTLYYQKGKDTILVAAPNKADAEEMFEWLAKKVGLIP